MLKNEELFTEKVYQYIRSRLEEVNRVGEPEFLLKANSLDAFLRDIEIAGIFNTNMWLTNNLSSLNNVGDLEKRISLFERILLDERMNEVRKKMGLAAYIVLARDYGAEFVDRLALFLKQNGYDDPDIDWKKIPFERIREGSFLEGKRILQRLLEDSEIAKLSDECHVKLLSGRIRDDWTEVEYFKAILSNASCLSNLHNLLKTLQGVNKPDIKKR